MWILFTVVFAVFAHFLTFATAITEEGIAVGVRFYSYDRVKLSWDSSKVKADKVFLKLHVESGSLIYELPTAVAGKIRRMLFGKVAQN